MPHGTEPMQTDARAASREHRPFFSVVVTDARGPAELERCVAAVRPQCERANAQLVVVAVDPASTLGTRRAAGLARATGEWVAMTEPPCVPDPDWLERLMVAAGPEVAILGGAVGNSRRTTARERAAFFAEYGLYGGTEVVRLPDGTPHVTAANAAYARRILGTVEAAFRANDAEPTLHIALRADGWSVRMVRDARVMFDADAELIPAFRDRFAHGRAYGATSASLRPAPARVLRALLSIAAVPLLAARIGRAAEREARADFFRSLPLTLVLLAGWALGESVGWLTERAQ